MSFVFKKVSEFTAKVRIHVPEDGRKVVREVEGQFLVVPAERIAEWASRDAQAGGDGAMLSEVLAGWSGIVDEGGAPVPFGDEARDAVLSIPYVRIPYVRIAFVKAYFEAINGEARRGN